MHLHPDFQLLGRRAAVELRAAGVWLFTGGLHDASTATVLRAQDDEVLVTDGPYLEGKEHLGGLTVIDVPDLDVALGWGRRMARATGLQFAAQTATRRRRAREECIVLTWCKCDPG